MSDYTDDYTQDKVYVLDCLNEVPGISLKEENKIGRPLYDNEGNIKINKDSLKMENKSHKNKTKHIVPNINYGAQERINADEKLYFNTFNQEPSLYPKTYYDIQKSKSNKEPSKATNFLQKTNEKACENIFKNNKVALWKYLIESAISLNTNNDMKYFYLICTHSHRLRDYIFDKFNYNKYNNCFCMRIDFKRKKINNNDIIIPIAKVVFKGFPEDANCENYEGPNYIKITGGKCETQLEEKDIIPLKVILSEQPSGGSNNDPPPKQAREPPPPRNIYMITEEFRILRAIKYDYSEIEDDYYGNYADYLHDNNYNQTKYYDVLGEFDTRTIENKFVNEIKRLEREIIKLKESNKGNESNERIEHLHNLLIGKNNLSMKIKKENTTDGSDEISKLYDLEKEKEEQIKEYTSEVSETFKKLFNELNTVIQNKEVIINIVKNLPKEISETEYRKINENISDKYVSVSFKEMTRNPRTNGENDLVRVKLQQKDGEEFEIDVDKIICLDKHDLITTCEINSGNLYFNNTDYNSKDNQQRIIKLNNDDFDKLTNTTLYLIRHGDSIHNSNTSSRYNPHRYTDSSLTPIGIAQSAYLGKLLFYDYINIPQIGQWKGFILSSFLNRAQHTGLQVLYNMTDYNYKIDKINKSRERLEEKIERNDFKMMYPKLFTLLELYNIMGINRLFYKFGKSPQRVYDLFKKKATKQLNGREIDKINMKDFIINCLKLKQVQQDFSGYFMYKHKSFSEGFTLNRKQNTSSSGGSRISKKHSKTLKKKRYNKRKTSMKKRKLRN